ncbi:MAG: helix-turn-helix domain-containing protein [Chloroflexi bacterium]|nr:helix-turn-helix domain-containing protein [Chloroflexota bacterium]
MTKKTGSHPYTRHTLEFDLPVFLSNAQKYADKVEQRRVILQLRAQGWSYRQIGREVGLHWTRVGQILKAAHQNRT